MTENEFYGLAKYLLTAAGVGPTFQHLDATILASDIITNPEINCGSNESDKFFSPVTWLEVHTRGPSNET